MNESWLADLLGYRFIRTEGTGGQTLPERATLVITGNVEVTDDPDRGATVLHIPVSGGSGGGTSEGTVRVFRARFATTAPAPLSGLGAYDDVEVQEGDIGLVWNQGDPTENGLYIARDVAWVRPDFADEGTELQGASLVAVSEGTAYGNKVFMMVTDEPVAVGAGPLDFQLIGSGDALSLRGVPLAPSTETPDAHTVLQSDGSVFFPALLDDDNVADDADIQVKKLKAGSSGQVLRTAGGKAVWGSVSTADLGENLVTAASVSGNQDNYTPSGWSSATIVRLQASAPLTIRGLGQATSRRKVLVNASAQPITLANNASEQAVGNKILTPRATTLLPGQSVVVVYDATESVWRLIDAPPNSFEELITFNGGILAANPRAKGTDEWGYEELRALSVYLPLESGCPISAGAAPEWGYAQSVWYARNEVSSGIDFPLPYPRDGRCRGFSVGVRNGNIVACQLRAQLVRITPNAADPVLSERETMVFSGGLGDPVEVSATLVVPPNTSGTLNLLAYDFPVNNSAYRYTAYIVASSDLSGGGTGDARGARIHWLKMHFGDRGPRNG